MLPRAAGRGKLRGCRPALAPAHKPQQKPLLPPAAGMPQLQQAGQYTGNALGNAGNVIAGATPIAQQGLPDYWGQGPLLAVGPCAGCRFWPEQSVWQGDPHALVSYWLTHDQYCEYYCNERAMQRCQMQEMMRAFPIEGRQYQRADGSCEPVQMTMAPGSYTGPEHFIGSTGTSAAWQSTGSTGNWYNNSGAPSADSWQQIPMQSSTGSGGSGGWQQIPMQSSTGSGGGEWQGPLAQGYTGGPTLTGQYPGADAAASAALGMVGHTINPNPAAPMAAFTPMQQHTAAGPGQGGGYTDEEMMAMNASSKAEIAAAKMAQLEAATEEAKLANREASVANVLLAGFNRRVEQLAELGTGFGPEAASSHRQLSPANSASGLSEPPTGSVHWELKPADQRHEGISISKVPADVLAAAAKVVEPGAKPKCASWPQDATLAGSTYPAELDDQALAKATLEMDDGPSQMAGEMCTGSQGRPRCSEAQQHRPKMYWQPTHCAVDKSNSRRS